VIVGLIVEGEKWWKNDRLGGIGGPRGNRPQKEASGFLVDQAADHGA
jgi:hypothetical protein